MIKRMINVSVDNTLFNSMWRTFILVEKYLELLCTNYKINLTSNITANH